jgi:hypothetical protein
VPAVVVPLLVVVLVICSSGRYRVVVLPSVCMSRFPEAS